MMAPKPDLIAIASMVLPGPDYGAARVARGQFHDVVLVPGVAAVRVARRAAAAAQLPRRMALLGRLGELGLPFAVPEVMSNVVVIDDRAAVAVSWLPGRPLPKGEGDPRKLAELLASVRSVDLDRIAELLDRPHAYAGCDAWLELMLNEAVPRLPSRLRSEAVRRTEEAAGLDQAVPVLVHGDLGGENVHWDESGSLVGILDWDLAQPFDHAVDVACVAWHGWRNVQAAVDAATYHRARVWSRTFAIEGIVAALTNGEPEDMVARFVESAIRVLEADRSDE